MSTNDEHHLAKEIPKVKQKLRKNKTTQTTIDNNTKWKQKN
jgi:hypothetical protein